ncbi:hypothetical protein Y032_0009g529 [Ancylostoma ceylanicum]|uniref:G-protein coupled receptors family 1 profile domain-containing protein n=1 Tax=Ancylostoma ceylanicum TaxID=53326 RepID=A0A016VK40_9BILA|nr:hypothetical protein Y032_0009g529 [Ancylostoma ceylanicum]
MTGLFYGGNLRHENHKARKTPAGDHFIYTVPFDSTTTSNEKIRVYLGCGIVLSNLLLLVFLNFRTAMRWRYIFYSLVAIGDILDGVYLIYPTLKRMAEIEAGTFSEEISLWGCTSKGYMMLRIYGTELASLTMLVMAAEKLFAVFLPLTYSVVKGFSQFHHLFNLTCQIGAFLGSTVVFLVARNFRKHANEKELISIQPILAVSFISCIVMSSNYIIYVLKHFLKINITKTQQHSVVTYSSALLQVSKFALYILAGREFRDCLGKIFKRKNCSQQTPTGTSVFLRKVSAVKANLPE